ncbi:hypothetical protein [Rhizobium leguminosarum]|nr:hypothetical protein [Rhizobium leguminosarum]
MAFPPVAKLLTTSPPFTLAPDAIANPRLVVGYVVNRCVQGIEKNTLR